MNEEFTPLDYERVRQEVERRKLSFYRPYLKQQEFHKAGATCRERLLRAGNQLGKTMACAAETAFHATGKYPSWWEGRVFKKAPVIWCAGVTGEVVRDTIQRLLVGDSNSSGFIPKEDIIEMTPSRGVADLKDTIFVKHSSGGTTRIRLKYYEQGREKFQGDTVDFGWPDEEPPLDIYMEMLTRTNATGGCMAMSFTPLKGMSDVVRRFLIDPSPDRSDTNMTIMDALHISEEARRKIIDSYPAHEKEARLNGTPMLGSGRIFPIAESEITVKAFNTRDMPWYWMEIAGIDFGWDHPTAAAKLLYDPQGDVVYVTNVYKRREATPLIHAAALKPWGRELQWAWPHDGLQHDKGSGETLAKQYVDQGLKMLPERAMFDDDRGNGVEAGIAEMLMRMESGRFKVFSHLTEFFEEFRLYHRKDGKVVKQFDDVLSSCLHPETEVITSKGKFQIQNLVGTMGRVLTIDGKWADYKNCRLTKKDAELVKVTFSDGYELLCTPDHELLSGNGEWICAIDSQGMVCHNAVSHTDGGTWNILNTVGHYIRLMIPCVRMGTMLAGAEDTCTELSMKRILVQFQKDIISTISMVTKQITSFLTYWQCLFLSIFQCTTRDIPDIHMQHWRPQKNGEKPPSENNSIGKWVCGISILCELCEILFAKIVGMGSGILIREPIDSAPMPASPLGGVNQGWMMRRGGAKFAEMFSEKINIKRGNIVRDHVGGKHGHHRRRGVRILKVLRVEPVNKKSDVYCMEVPETSAFALANGAIVHNCRYGIMCLRFAQPILPPVHKPNNAQGNFKSNYNPLSVDHIKRALNERK